MSTLHRELAPITAAAWAEIEEEASRTFKRNIAGRRIVDLVWPSGFELAAIGTGHTTAIDAPAPGVAARLRTAQPVVELKVAFTVTRAAVDNVERGAKDSDWDPVKEAATKMALSADRAIFADRSCPGTIQAAARSGRRAVLGTSGCGGIRHGKRNLRPWLPGARPPQPIDRRRDHLGTRDRLCPGGHHRGRAHTLRAALATKRGWAAPTIKPLCGYAVRTPSSTDRNMPSPSSLGPVSGSVACSGCGIRPTTRPFADAMPAIPRSEPLMFSPA